MDFRTQSTNQFEELSPEYIPETIVNREYEYAAIQNVVSSGHPQNLFIHGKRGTGKTHLTRHVLRKQIPSDEGCYIPCTRIDKQYQVLQQILHRLTGKEVSSGYHTAELKQRIGNHLSDQRLVLVLDDIEFLLENNGDDLLYYLSRMRHEDTVAIVGISSNYADPSAIIEARTLSTFQPSTVSFEPYAEAEVVEILEQRLQKAQLQSRVEDAALKQIAKQTVNVRRTLAWLTEAAAAGSGQITWNRLRTAKESADQRYREALLQGFTQHHQLLLESINHLESEEDDVIFTGSVYQEYTKLCQAAGVDPLSSRRISDFITHLKLLDIITVEDISGGAKGRTREIRLRNPM